MTDPERHLHPPPSPGGRGQGPHPGTRAGAVPPADSVPTHGAVPPPPPPGSHPMIAPHAPRKRGPFIATGVVLLVLGLLGIAAAVLIFIMPFGLFLLGGGGNTEAFDDFAAGFRALAILVAGVSVLLAGGGITLIVVGSRRR